LSKKDYIKENMESNDDFIKGMYTDLYTRIDEYEQTESVVERIKFSDTIGSIVTVGIIALYLAYVMIN